MALKQAIGNYSIEYYNKDAGPTVLYSATTVIVNPAGTVAGISSGATTTLPTNVVTSSQAFRLARYINTDPTPNADPTNSAQAKTISISALPYSTYSGKIFTRPDTANQAQNLFNAKVSNVSSANGLNNAVDTQTSNAILNTNSYTAAGNFTGAKTTVSNMLGSNALNPNSPASTNSQVYALFPGIRLPGQSGFLNNNDSSLISKQASAITLPQNIVDSIATGAAVSGVALALTTAQIRAQSQLQAQATAAVANRQTAAFSAIATAKTTVTSAGSAANLPGSAAATASANTALGGSALADKVKSTEKALNAAQTNVLAAINNPVKKAETAVKTAAEGLAVGISVKLAAPAVTAALDIAGKQLKTLIGGIPFIGSGLTSLSTTQIEQKLGTLGTALANWTAAPFVFIGQQIGSLFATALQQEIAQQIQQEAAQIALDAAAQIAAQEITLSAAAPSII